LEDVGVVVEALDVVVEALDVVVEDLRFVYLGQLQPYTAQVNSLTLNSINNFSQFVHSVPSLRTHQFFTHLSI
jgi:hypothetical protein